MWDQRPKLPLSPNPTPPPHATPGPAESNFLSATSAASVPTSAARASRNRRWVPTSRPLTPTTRWVRRIARCGVRVWWYDLRRTLMDV